MKRKRKKIKMRKSNNNKNEEKEEAETQSGGWQTREQHLISYGNDMLHTPYSMQTNHN
jgi:hypothetical protein